jgi:pimeloyl-ACP methyl ester carboxylesterase
MADQPNIVLAHGAWADGSSWSAVIESLQAAEYRVTALQFPLTRLADDVARLRRVLARQDGPTVVVGHSYGGQIVTALGEDAPNVVGLVYIAGFALDEGESIAALLGQASDPVDRAPRLRRGRLRLAVRGRLLEPLRGRRRSE